MCVGTCADLRGDGHNTQHISKQISILANCWPRFCNLSRWLVVGDLFARLTDREYCTQDYTTSMISDTTECINPFCPVKQEESRIWNPLIKQYQTLTRDPAWCPSLSITVASPSHTRNHHQIKEQQTVQTVLTPTRHTIVC